MKTTVNLDDELLAQVKAMAAQRGTTLTRVIEDALRTMVLASASPEQFRLRLPTVRGERPPPIDVADRDALHEVMDRGGARG